MKILVCEINFAAQPAEYFASALYATDTSDTPADLNMLGRLQAVEIERVASVSLWQSKQDSKPVITSIVLENVDGRLNDWRTRSVKNQTIRIWIGERNAAFSTFQPLATLKGETHTVTDTVNISMTATLGALDAPVSELYDSSLPFGSGRRLVALGALAYAPTEFVQALGNDFFTNLNGEIYSLADADIEQLPTARLLQRPRAIPFFLGAPWFGFRANYAPPEQDSCEIVMVNLIGSQIPGSPPRSTKQIRELIIEICRRGGIAEGFLDATSLANLVADLPWQCGLFAKEQKCNQLLDFILRSCGGGYYEQPNGSLRFWWPGSAVNAPVARITVRQLNGAPVVTPDDAPGLSSRWVCALRASQNLPSTGDGLGGLVSTLAPNILHERYQKLADGVEPVKTIWRDIANCQAVHNSVAAAYSVERFFTDIDFEKSEDGVQILPFDRITIEAGVPGYAVDTIVTVARIKQNPLNTNIKLTFWS